MIDVTSTLSSLSESTTIAWPSCAPSLVFQHLRIAERALMGVILPH